MRPSSLVAVQTYCFRIVTVTLNAAPAALLAGAVTRNFVAPPLANVTFTVADPVWPPPSVAVTVWLPAVFKVTPLLKVCMPLSPARSEDRRVGKECRSRLWAYHY